MSRRARQHAGARPWAQPRAGGLDVDLLLAQARCVAAREPPPLGEERGLPEPTDPNRPGPSVPEGRPVTEPESWEKQANPQGLKTESIS